MQKIISEFKSDDGLRTAMVLTRADEFRVVYLDSYFEHQSEGFFRTLQEAEDHAEDWVLKA